MSNSLDSDFIETIRIAQYWRQQLGEVEYVKRNPDDLRRWYIALENRGPDDIRAMLIERTNRYPGGQIVGIVATPPHPSREIIELWLQSHQTVRTGVAWAALTAFALVSLLIGANLAACLNMVSVNKPYRPPTLTLTSPSSGNTQPAGGGSTAPASLPADANGAAPAGAGGASGGTNGGAPAGQQH